MSNYYSFTNYFLYFLNSRWNIIHNSGFSQNIVVRTYRTAVPLYHYNNTYNYTYYIDTSIQHVLNNY